MNRFLARLACLVLAVTTPALAQYISPNRLELRLPGNRTGMLDITPQPRQNVRWDLHKGTCYAHQIAAAEVHPWRRDARGRAYFPVTVQAARPGSCQMWFTSGQGEVSAWITVR